MQKTVIKVVLALFVVTLLLNFVVSAGKIVHVVQGWFMTAPSEHAYSTNVIEQEVVVNEELVVSQPVKAEETTTAQIEQQEDRFQKMLNKQKERAND